MARSSRSASTAYSVMCASFRSSRSQVPRWVESDGTDENAKITAAQTTTGSQRETIPLYSRR